jgi:hypothetical protein
MNGWFPKINSLGEIVSGAGSIWFNGSQIASPGTYPGWYDDNTIIFIGQNDYLWMIDKDGTGLVKVSSVKYNLLCAGNRKVIGFSNPDIYINGNKIIEGTAPSISKDGNVITYATPYFQDNVDVIVNATKVGSGLVFNTSSCKNAVCWSVANGGGRDIYGKLAGGPVAKLSLVKWEEAILVDVDGQFPWIISRLHDDTMNAHPWGEKFGYHFNSPCWSPDALFVNGKILVACSDGNGNPTNIEIDINLPRVDLTLANPVEPPIEPPIEPPVEPPMFYAPNRIETVKRIMREHPEIDTSHEEERAKILDYFCDEENPEGQNYPWGRKARNSDGSNKNTDGLTYLLDDNRFEIIDAINGWDGDDEPIPPGSDRLASWENYGAFSAGENGYWAPAEPIDDSGNGGGGTDPNPDLPPNVHPITYPSNYVGPKDLGDWMDNEFPQVVKAFQDRQNRDPDYSWAAFQTCRRYGSGLPPGEDAWLLEDMIKHEQNAPIG